MSKPDFIKAVRASIEELRDLSPKEALLVAHDDADGVCSAAIAKLALDRIGCEAKLLFLEKFFPEVVAELHQRKGFVLYVDIGSAHASLVSRLNQGRCLTLILDHHVPEAPTDPRVFNLCPELFGISGSREASGATTCYVFARELSSANKDLAWITPIGSVEIPGDLVGLNREVLNDTKEVEIVRNKAERYRIVHFKDYARRIATRLTVLASVGYYKGGPELAVKSLVERGFSEEVLRLEKELEQRRKELNRRALSEMRSRGLEQTKHFQWFHAGELYADMGTKVIGSLCSYLKFQRFVNPARYLMVFMNMSKLIPGWGEMKVKGSLVKVSMRTPRVLEGLIERGKLPHAGKLLKRAIEDIGGVVGEGHAFAASGVVYAGQESELIERMEELIEEV